MAFRMIRDPGSVSAGDSWTVGRDGGKPVNGKPYHPPIMLFDGAVTGGNSGDAGWMLGPPQMAETPEVGSVDPSVDHTHPIGPGGIQPQNTNYVPIGHTGGNMVWSGGRWVPSSMLPPGDPQPGFGQPDNALQTQTSGPYWVGGGVQTPATLVTPSTTSTGLPAGSGAVSTGFSANITSWISENPLVAVGGVSVLAVMLMFMMKKR